MKRIVFAGPSLARADGGRHGSIEIRPPARKGDLIVAAHDGAAVIGLVDGFFETQPSVWHKEILYCLARGIAVAGASSMGALRAAECAPFGMTGIGAIFEDYHLGRRVADADVAVLHAPAALGYAPLTVALVDVEATVGRMGARGALSPGEAEAVLAAARALHFKERSWEAILASVTRAGHDGALLARRLSGHRVSLKQEDCRALLDFVASWNPAEAGTRPGFGLQNTAFLAGLTGGAERTRSS
jgi:hypothetical protein